jgi:tRNA(Ile)-lysidine synthase
MLIDLDGFGNFDKIFIAFSGGLDSTVLLDLLAKTQFRAKLSLIHVHHGISNNADFWLQNAENISKAYEIPLHKHFIIPESSANFEAWARAERYKIFASYLNINDVLLTGHHLDDQTETVLMNIARGTGIKGLVGMTQALKTLGNGVLMRPLIKISKKSLLEYANTHNLTWVEDESNSDLLYSRNFIRHMIVPKFKEKWPKFTSNIAALSNNANNTYELLQDLAVLDCPDILNNNNQLSLLTLRDLPEHRIINVLKIWLDKHKVQVRNSKILQRMIDEVIFARIDASPIVSWDNYQIRRYRDTLYLITKFVQKKFPDIIWHNFPAPFKHFSGETLFIENFVLLAEPSDPVTISYSKSNGKVKYRGYTKQIGKLYQEWGIPPWKRSTCMLLMMPNKTLLGYHK